MKTITSLLILILLFLAAGSLVQLEGFYVAFLSSLLAGLIIALISVIIVDNFTSFFTKPNLVMRVGQNSETHHYLTASLNANGLDYEFSFKPSIFNSGNRAINSKEGYWHIYFDGPSVRVASVMAAASASDFYHFRDIISSPIFPKAFLDLGVEFKVSVKKEEIKNLEIHYFFSTAYGNFPKKARPNEEDAIVLLEHMAKIPVKFD